MLRWPLAFERRRAESTSGLSVQVAQSAAALRNEIGQWDSATPGDRSLEVRLRTEICQVDGGVRHALSQTESAILRELGNNRFDLLKWSFLFWIGQVVAMSAIMAAMLRIGR